MEITKGTKINFKSAYHKANGSWMVFNILFLDGAQCMSFARLSKNGELKAVKAQNLMSIESAIVYAALETGTATII